VLTGDALAAAYANFDLFVFPSDTDTFGNVILEAFASGVPVVATGCGGPRYLVTDGVNGFLRPEITGQADAVCDLMRDPGRAAAMGLAARESARAASWPRVCERVYDAYDECVRLSAGRDESTAASPGDLSWVARLVTAGLARRRRPRPAPAAA